jgi:hypothetical protein
MLAPRAGRGDSASGLTRARGRDAGVRLVVHRRSTGQDGFSADLARGFQQTPEEFQFGVCAPGGSDPLCSFPANQVPKALDVIPPAGVSQATELNPLFGPVQLQGVTMQP